MNKHLTNSFDAVKILTLMLVCLQSGCAYINRHYGEHCNSHAYVHIPIDEYLSKRFHTQAPVRMAIIPFSASANITLHDRDTPSVGNELSWRIHSAFLQNETFAIAEVLNREDWPGKKEEFFTGNYGALAMAREAGYDLVMVGVLENLKTTDTFSAYSKIVDVESGVTIWYGKSSAYTLRRDELGALDYFGFQDRRPDLVYSTALTEALAACIVDDVLREPDIE